MMNHDEPMTIYIRQDDEAMTLSIGHHSVSLDAFEVMTMAAAEGPGALSPHRIGERLAEKMLKAYENCPYSPQTMIEAFVAFAKNDEA
jgi:hypothetical protein